MNLGVFGLGRMGRFRLEQLRLYDEVAAVIGCDPEPKLREQSRELVSRTTPVPEDVWTVPGLDAVLFASPVDRQFELIRAALERGLNVAIESPLAFPPNWEALSSADRVLVLDSPRDDDELALAQSLVGSNRLGDVRTVRYVSRELRLPDEREAASTGSTESGRGVLERFAPALFARLHTLIAVPDSVFGRVFRDAAGNETGFAAHFADRSGRTANIEVRMDSLIGERSGWVIEGDLATLFRKRLYSRLPDGEILDQPARSDSDDDAHSSDRWWRRLADREACRRSMAAAVWAASAMAAVRESDRTGAAVAITGRAD